MIDHEHAREMSAGQWLMMVGGAFLIGAGISRGGLKGLAAAGLGGALMQAGGEGCAALRSPQRKAEDPLGTWYAGDGHEQETQPVSPTAPPASPDVPTSPAAGMPFDEADRVAEASEESFPASDPPGWSPSHG